MQKQSTPGGMKILRNEQGNILILGVFLILIISMLFAGMVEFGRVMLVREQLQTAADSAALAGAGSGTHRYVKINVISDRGRYQPGCSPKKCPPCRSCGFARINGIVGNEVDLIDKGGWRDYIIPPCDCGGGDGWFELVDRKIMYDTYSMGWGSDPQEINNAEIELTNTSRDILAKTIYDYESHVSNMIAGMTLQQMSTLLESQQNWIRKWMAAKGYTEDCRVSSIHVGSNSDCYNWKSTGYDQYDKISTKKALLDNMIQTLNNMRGSNSRPVQKIDAQYAGAAATFFDANLPKHAVDSGITNIKVYGYEDRNSPYYPSVVVYATAKIKTLFPQWFNEDFNTTVCAQGTTAYRDADEQIATGNKFYDALRFGKWRKLPDKACWVDL